MAVGMWKPIPCKRGGFYRDRMEDEAMRLGAVAYLRKPFDEQCLLDAIRSLRRGNSGKEVVPFEGRV